MADVLSLYRRHRPRTFEEVVGQEHIVRTLKNAIELGKVHHAYLFVGSRGTGKTSMAKLLACALNAEGGPRADFSPEPFVKVIRHVRGTEKIPRESAAAILEAYLAAMERLVAYLNEASPGTTSFPG